MRARDFLFGAFSAVLVLSASLIVAGCHHRIDEGVYENTTGQMAVEFRDGKVFLTMGGQSSDALPYEVKGDKVTIHGGTIVGDVTLTRNSDGTLQGEGWGILRKKGS
jgi:hypothetical protein